MIFEFKIDTVYLTIGQIILSSKKCRRLLQPNGIKSRMSYKIYDINDNLIGEYSSSVKGHIKSIARDMYKIQSGSIESICYPHPY